MEAVVVGRVEAALGGLRRQAVAGVVGEEALGAVRILDARQVTGRENVRKILYVISRSEGCRDRRLTKSPAGSQKDLKSALSP